MQDFLRIGEQLGNEAFTVYGLSPLLFGQRGVRNYQYLPRNRDLPRKNLIFSMQCFSWGFTPDTPGLAALETQNKVLQILTPTFVWALNGVTNDNTGPAGSSLGFQFNFSHTHDGTQYRWFNRPLLNIEALGTGQRPKTLVQPHLFLPGDSIECEVKNLGRPVSPALTSVQVVLFCGEIGREATE